MQSDRMNEDRVLKTEHGHFELSAWPGKNLSGIEPLCDKVLVLVDNAMDKTRGGIIITEVAAGTQTLSSCTGILVAVGPQAFLWDSDRSTRWEGERPAAGLRVVFTKYAGLEYPGLDGRLYRLMQDRQIGGSMGIAAVEKPSKVKKGRTSGISTGSNTIVSGQDAPFAA
jgi:co-chaperonin GroES (HSP10)